jgi:hypothetical protein
MSTGTALIKDSLRRIGAFSIAQQPEPGEIVDGMDVLNSMIQLWRSWGIMQDLVPLEVPGDNLNEPIDAKNAIIDNLALMLAPNYDNGVAQGVVSAQLKANARLGLHQVKVLYQDCPIPEKVPSTTLPKGAGNQKGNFRQDTFFDKEGDFLDG